MEWDQHEEEGFRLEMSSTSIIFIASLASAAPSLTLTLVFLKLFPTLGVVVRSVVVDSDLIDSVADLILILKDLLVTRPYSPNLIFIHTVKASLCFSIVLAVTSTKS